MRKKTAPERIRDWVAREFNSDHVDTQRVFEDLLDVAAGTREGNAFERQAIDAIFRHSWEDCGEGPFLTKQEALDFAEAEVGARWRVVFVPRRGWIIQTKW